MRLINDKVFDLAKKKLKTTLGYKIVRKTINFNCMIYFITIGLNVMYTGCHENLQPVLECAYTYENILFGKMYYLLFY